MKSRFVYNLRRRRGMALIMVISILGLMTLLTVAMFTLSESELKGARYYASGQESKNLADVAVSIAISQLRKSTTQDFAASGRETWISQPGMVRRYDGAGTLQSAFKLYSSSQMVVAGGVAAEAGLLQDKPPADWQSQPRRYVDLNKPVVRADSQGQPTLRFPIVDPRAMSGTPNSVGGFGYTDTFADGSKLPGVVTSGGDAQRVPMPVEWLYVLKDGSLGVLNGAGKFVGVASPSSQNPIVGRIAFWTDDESSKLNLNTAAEPTPWALPTFFHDTDANWALKQPVNGELQRYPGHPATTALSPVLFPGKTLTWQEKDHLYGLVPKIGPGGSHSGNVLYDDPNIEAVELRKFHKEHLYANLDEFLLKQDRTANSLGATAVTADTLQRAAFFLTTNSRAPESNPFGLPKVAMWPVSYRGPDFRSSFDNLIAFCATLQKSSGRRQYLFQRGYADSASADVEHEDNQALLKWLLEQFSRPVPGFGADGTQNFRAKYGDDLPQILIEMFDYIRSANLQDPYLVDEKFKPENTTANVMLGYAGNFARPFDFKTFTDPRFVQNGVDGETGQMVENEFRAFPGHGQVTPSLWTPPGSSTPTLGIARFPTISEVGLHFICAADNTNDAKNPFKSDDPNIGKPGGSTAPKLSSSDGNVKDRWYSNFPPNPAPDPSKGQKPNVAKYPKTEGFPYGKDPEHPGYKPVNWNWQLVANTPLKPGFRRVQARLLLEFFVPAAGYTVIEPEFSVRVKGLSGYKLNGQPLFPNDEEVVRTGRRLTHNGTTQAGGYGFGLKAFMREREVPARTPMPEDNQWGAEKWQVKPTSDAGASLSVLNYDLVSSFLDIEVGPAGGKDMQISPASLEIEIISGHLGKQTAPPESPPATVQTLFVPFPANTVRPPTLVRNAIAEEKNAKGVVTSPAVEPPYWWTFYGKGCMGFSVANLKKGTAQVIGGRFWGTNTDPMVANEPRRGAFFYGFDPLVAGAPRPFRAQITPGNPDKAEENEGSDVVQTVTIKHGDYRLAAAKSQVPADDWKPHRNWGSRRLAHNFTNQTSNQLPGYDYGGTADLGSRLVSNSSGATYANNRIPDFPFFMEAQLAAHRTGDFDNAFGPERDGPYINKPDEGSLGGANKKMAYYEAVNNATKAGGSFFTPNRQISSPVMFGSLPTGVKRGEAWRTLLFRPQQGHPGGPEKLGGSTPPDHLFLEFFWMPVVEPYAISEPFSTAGKVNLNYQILPFTHITRSSGLRGVIENELVTAVDEKDMSDYKAWPDNGNHDRFWKDSEGKKWHHKVDVAKTLAQFEDRFRRGKVFLSASEICEVHLVPEGVNGAGGMEKFWSSRRLTGDNTRERPYTSIYPRVTTRSNSFRVHFITQVIKKARSSPVDSIEDADRVISEHRGSAVIQRYLDPSRRDLPDFAAGLTSDTLDAYHEFRVVETKRFGF